MDHNRVSVLLAVTIIGVGLNASLLRLMKWAPDPLTLSLLGELTYGNIPGVTSVLFIALACGLALIHARGTVALAQIVAAGILLLSLLVLVAYL